MRTVLPILSREGQLLTPTSRDGLSVVPNHDPEPHGGNSIIAIDSGYDPAPHLAVRAVSLRDLASLSFSFTRVPLLVPECELVHGSALRSGISSMTPGRPTHHRMFVVCADGSPLAFVEWQSVAPDRRWQAVSLGAPNEGVVPDLGWAHLLAYSAAVAGGTAVKRLYAKARSGSDLLAHFRRAGYSAYATETIFEAAHPFAPGSGSQLRTQETADTWAIHQLYNASTPRQVQYAEALTSHRWELAQIDRARPAGRRRAWLLDEGHYVMVYTRVTSSRGRHVIEVMYDPSRSDALADAVDGVLRRLFTAGSRDTAFVALRGYQAEAAKVLEARGFEPVLEQDLLVKYTAASIRPATLEPIPFHSEVIERLPKRVPSFLQSPRRDETVP